MRAHRPFVVPFLSLSTILTLSLNSVADVYDSRSENVGKTAWSLKQTLVDCPNRIWPHLKLAKHDVLIVNSDVAKQVAVSAKNNRIYTLENGQLPPHVFHSAFSFPEVDGRPGVHVSSEYSDVFLLAVHEAFHAYDQSTWTREGEKGARGTSLPFLAAPRIARNMLYRHLVNAYHDKANRSQHLSKAKYWNEEWKRVAMDEFQSTTDDYEGTARYVDIVASALAATACSATEQTLEKMISQDIVLRGESIVGFTSFDSEGYFVGALASLVLRFGFPEKNWHADIEKGGNPVEILLRDIPIASSDKAPAELQKYIQARTKEQNNQANDLLRDTVAALASPSSVFITVPSDALKGSFSPYGFYTDRESMIQYIPMFSALKFEVGDSGQVNTASRAVFFDLPLATPCSGWTFVVSSNEVSMGVGDQATIKSPYAEGTFGAKKLKDSQGRTWVCAEGSIN